MALLYTVGPSRAGKSALCRELEQIDQRIYHQDLDLLMVAEHGVDRPDRLPHLLGGWGPFWNSAKGLIEEAEQQAAVSKRIVLLNIGAGGLQTDEGRKYFIDRADRLICVWAVPEVLRERHGARDYGNLLQTEYAPHRKAVYEAARFLIDTSHQDIAASLEEFGSAVDSLLGLDTP